jgi:hypothetical protein
MLMGSLDVQYESQQLATATPEAISGLTEVKKRPHFSLTPLIILSEMAEL